jgi:hypothetical protein
MPSRFDDDCFGTGRGKENLMPSPDFLVPTSAGEQFRSGGWMRTGKPAGGTPPVSPAYPLSGNAGMDTDNDADDSRPIAAILLRDTQP